MITDTNKAAHERFQWTGPTGAAQPHRDPHADTPRQAGHDEGPEVPHGDRGEESAGSAFGTSGRGVTGRHAP